MAKVVKKPSKETDLTGKSKTIFNIPVKYQTLMALAVIVVVFMIYYAPMYFGNETFHSGDIITSESARSYLDNEHEEYTLWYPYIFCGMPGYALTVDFKWFNMMYVGFTAVKRVVASMLSTDYAIWSFYLLILAFTSYFLISYLTKNKLIALFGSLSTAFTTGIILFLMIGHVTKLTALCFFPLILLMLLKFEKKITIKDIAILIIAIQLSLQGFHVQIIFYMVFAIAIYYIYNIIRSLIEKRNDTLKQFIKSGLIFTGALLIAVLIQSDNFTQIWEYNEYSTRGTKSILETTNVESSKSDSDFYQYATNWSFPPEDLGTFLVPSFMGFGKSIYNGPLTNNQPYMVNTYFGEIPLTENPMYMGVIVLFLAMFGIFANYKNRFVQFLVLTSLLSLLLAFGRYFSPVFDLMFYYFPFFDKFRAPIMSLVLIQLCLPILAAFGIKSILEIIKSNDTRLKKTIYYSAITFTALLVISFLLNGVIKDWFSGRVNEFAATNQQMAQQFRALSGYISDMFARDLHVSLGLCAIVFWLAYAFIIKKIPAAAFLIAVIVLSFTDLARVNKRFEEYIPAQSKEGLFVEPSYITAIKNQNNEEPFRILNLKQDGSLGSFNSNSNFNAHFLVHDFYGYSAIKPRSYQDYMDVVGPANQTLWRMLNIKYIVLDQQTNVPFLIPVHSENKTFLYEFTGALPRAYFVDSLATAPALEILNMVKSNSFDPGSKAFVYDNPVNIDRPDSTAKVRITKYLDERIEMDVYASGNNLLFLGDTYYPNGWQAFVDGQETEILRVNHGFRGIVVPEGEHRIEFVYLPKSFVISKYTALFLSSAVVVLLVLGVFIERKKNQAA